MEQILVKYRDFVHNGFDEDPETEKIFMDMFQDYQNLQMGKEEALLYNFNGMLDAFIEEKKIKSDEN